MVTNRKLIAGVISKEEKEEVIGAEKGRLLPTEIGMVVSDYLVGNFSDILNYGFTAGVENDFDKIAEGDLDWHKCIGSFYTPFHEEVDKALNDKQYHKVERELGIDPSDGKKVVAKLGQFGPYVQKGDDSEKIYASLGKGQLIESITLEDALKLFSLPRKMGEFEGNEIVLKKGKFGAYMQYGTRNISLPKGDDPLKLTLQDCIDIIQKTPAKTAIHEWGNISVLNGPFGPYIKAEGKNYKLPKGTDPALLTEDQCKEIINTQSPTQKRKSKK